MAVRIDVLFGLMQNGARGRGRYENIKYNEIFLN
jgi:hypothetical protein